MDRCIYTETRHSNGYQNGSQLCNYLHALPRIQYAKSTVKPKTWLRLIDDIFMVWSHGIQALTLYMDMLNSHHPTIKFTYEYNKQDISFLDTIVYKTANNELFTQSLPQTHRQQTIYTIFTQPTLESRRSQFPMDY